MSLTIKGVDFLEASQGGKLEIDPVDSSRIVETVKSSRGVEIATLHVARGSPLRQIIQIKFFYNKYRRLIEHHCIFFIYISQNNLILIKE